MNHLYNIIIELVDKLILPILSLFSKKINRFRINRIDLIEKIKNELIDKNENIDQSNVLEQVVNYMKLKRLLSEKLNRVL